MLVDLADAQQQGHLDHEHFVIPVQLLDFFLVQFVEEEQVGGECDLGGASSPQEVGQAADAGPDEAREELLGVGALSVFVPVERVGSRVAEHEGVSREVLDEPQRVGSDQIFETKTTNGARRDQLVSCSKHLGDSVPLLDEQTLNVKFQG